MEQIMTDYESPSNKDSPSEEQNFNDGANLWHYDIGVPTIPGKFKTKQPCVKWEGYQTNPPPKRSIRIGLIEVGTAVG